MFSHAGKIWRRDFRDREIQNLRREQKVSKMQKPKLHTTLNWYSLHWTTKLKQRKLLKANTLLSVTEIGGRIAIKHSKEFPRILNSLRSLHKVDLWLLSLVMWLSQWGWRISQSQDLRIYTLKKHGPRSREPIQWRISLFLRVRNRVSYFFTSKAYVILINPSLA